MPGYKGETWNPIVGCSKISEGCENCYAERMAVRLSGMNKFAYKRTTTDGKWNGHYAWNISDEKPVSWRSPRMIFVCSMGDLFLEQIDFSIIRAIFEIIEKCPQHIFVVLTKRPARADAFFKWNPLFENLPNVWLGVTAENQQRANERIPILLQIKAAKRFVSIEPMLGPVDLKSIVFKMSDGNGEFIVDALTGTVFTEGDSYNLDWVICGGETGPKARPMHMDWAAELCAKCYSAKVPFFFKQIGEWKLGYGSVEDRNKQFKHVHGYGFTRVGHKAAGRALYGVEFNEFPKTN